MAGDSQNAEAASSAHVKVYQCPSCGGVIQIRAVGQSLAAACESCGTVVDVTDETLRILSKARGLLKHEPAIPLGTKGKLKGTVWQVIGFMRRCDESNVYHWSEYLLFNPYKGFRWLTEANGHWNYVTMLHEKPKVVGGASLRLFNDQYRIYERGSARVTYVAGEFYWRVREGEKVRVEDYIHPPHMVSREVSASEEIWSAAEYIESNIIQDAFHVTGDFPAKQGMAPNEPFAAGQSATSVATTAVMLVLVLIMVQIFCAIIFPQQFVTDGDLRFAWPESSKSQSSPPFELTGRNTNVAVMLRGNVDNNWADVTVSLVNTATGASYESDREISYYYGRDSDGAWAEGSPTDELIFSTVPSGTYLLTVDPGGRSWQGELNLYYKIERDVPLGSNLFAAICLVLIFPILLGMYTYHVEKKRWENSDFSPYQSSEG